MTSDTTLVRIQKLSKNFSRRQVLDEISLEIDRGEFISVIGSSGSGKSTFLRLLAGLEHPTKGQILLSRPLRLSFVFQEAGLLPWRTVEENIRLPFELLKESPRHVEEALQMVGLSACKALYPHQLSGGMKMRASIARALVTQPELLLMDEPFAALDEVTRFSLQDQLLNLCAQIGLTTVFVTHSISEAVYLSDRVFLLDQWNHKLALGEKINLPRPRSQNDKSLGEYNNYVTFFAKAFRVSPA